MAVEEVGAQNSEGTRIILVDGGGNAVEVTARAVDGASELLGGLRTGLVAAIRGGLFEPKPFTFKQEESIEAPKAPTSTNRRHTLELATTAYRAKLQSPEDLFNFFQAHWDYYGIEWMGLSKRDTRVVDVPYKEEDIWQFMKLDDPQAGNPGADLAYFHLPVLASADGYTRVLMGKGFPYMGSLVFESGYNIRNGHTSSGWMRVDAGLDAPFRTNKKGELTGLNENELKRAIIAASRVGQTINIYALSGDVIKKIYGYFPDQGATWSRLPESFEDDRVLNADFDECGLLSVNSNLDSEDQNPSIGGRSFLGA